MADKRLIDANALRKGLREAAMESDVSLRDVLTTIDLFPTIDAVEVVRCRECVHYKHKDAMTPGDNRMRCDHPCLDYDIECYDQWLDVEPDDYCKYGERKMDGGAEG